jgi:hypothetical protein
VNYNDECQILFLDALQNGKEYATKAFERAQKMHAARNCISRGPQSPQRRKLLERHGKLEPLLTVAFSRPDRISSILPSSLSSGRSIMDILRDHRPSDSTLSSGILKPDYHSRNSKINQTQTTNYPQFLTEDVSAIANAETQVYLHRGLSSTDPAYGSSTLHGFAQTGGDVYSNDFAPGHITMGLSQPSFAGQVKVAFELDMWDELQNLSTASASQAQERPDFYDDFWLQNNTRVYTG